MVGLEEELGHAEVDRLQLGRQVTPVGGRGPGAGVDLREGGGADGELADARGPDRPARWRSEVAASVETLGRWVARQGEDVGDAGDRVLVSSRADTVRSRVWPTQVRWGIAGNELLALMRTTLAGGSRVDAEAP